jgi:hypothetical protein
MPDLLSLKVVGSWQPPLAPGAPPRQYGRNLLHLLEQDSDAPLGNLAFQDSVEAGGKRQLEADSDPGSGPAAAGSGAAAPAPAAPSKAAKGAAPAKAGKK